MNKKHNQYYVWLTHQVSSNGKKLDALDRDMLEWLHTKAFYPIITNDDNRAGDGVYLRYEWATETDNNDHKISGPCTMLEMLIALARRFDFNVRDHADNEQTGKWFWMFLKNLRLKPILGPEQTKYNDEVIEKFIKRTYQPNGVGGLFPLENPSKDQRYIEIWYQMMSFIAEEIY